MADTPVEITLAVTSQGTMTLSVYADGSDTISNTGGDTASEATNRAGLYLFTVVESLAGLFFYKVADSSGNIHQTGYINLTDTTTTHRPVPGVEDVSDISLNQQEIRDSMQLAPTTDSPATGSVDEELDAIRLQTDKITNAGISGIDKVFGGGHITIVRGDTHPSSEGAGLEFVLASGEDWPTDLSEGWTISMTWRENSDNTGVDGTDTINFVSGTNVTITIDTATGGSRQITISDFTQSVMQNLATGESVYSFDIQASKSSDRMTMRSGTVTVVIDQTRES